MSLPPHKAQLYGQAIRAVAVGLVANLLLGVAKVIAGVVASSFALIADAVNSLGDTLTSIAVLIALRISLRPPDEEHPYGHTRAEAVAGSSVALVVILSALIVGWQAVSRVGHTHPIPPSWTLWLAGANAVLKEALFQYKSRVARRTGSTALLAVAWDHRSDAFCALAVLVGLAVVRIGGPELIAADEVAALVVVAVILFAAGKLFRAAVLELMDAQAAPDYVASVREAAVAVDEVLAIEKLRIRKSGMEYLVDIHVQVDPELSVRRSHTVGHRVKDQLLGKFSQLRDVLVHIEPFEGIAAADTDDPSAPDG